MRIHVVDLVGIDAGVTHGRNHAATSTIAIFQRRSHVMRIGTHTKTEQLGINFCTASFCVFVLFKHHDASTFAEHETVTFGIPGARCGCRVVIARGQRTRSSKATQAERRYRGFGTAGDHHVGITVFNEAPGFAYAMQTRRAGGNDRQIRAFETVFDRQVPRDHVDDRGGNEERADAARTTAGQFCVGLLNHRQAANTGTDKNTDALRIGLCYFQSAILHCLHAGSHAVMNEGIHMTGFFTGDVILDIESLDLTRKMRGEGGGIKLGDGRDAGLSGEKRVP